MLGKEQKAMASCRHQKVAQQMHNAGDLGRPDSWSGRRHAVCPSDDPRHGLAPPLGTVLDRQWTVIIVHEPMNQQTRGPGNRPHSQRNQQHCMDATLKSEVGDNPGMNQKLTPCQ